MRIIIIFTLPCISRTEIINYLLAVVFSTLRPKTRTEIVIQAAVYPERVSPAPFLPSSAPLFPSFLHPLHCSPPFFIRSTVPFLSSSAPLFPSFLHPFHCSLPFFIRSTVPFLSSSAPLFPSFLHPLRCSLPFFIRSAVHFLSSSAPLFPSFLHPLRCSLPSFIRSAVPFLPSSAPLFTSFLHPFHCSLPFFIRSAVPFLPSSAPLFTSFLHPFHCSLPFFIRSTVPFLSSPAPGLVTAPRFETDRWYHVEMSWHPNHGLRFFVDNKLLGESPAYSVSGQPRQDGGHFYIGRPNDGDVPGGRYTTGNFDIDELEVWNGRREDLLAFGYIERGEQRGRKGFAAC